MIMKVSATIMMIALIPIGIGLINCKFKIAEVGLGMMIIAGLVAIWS